MNHFHRVIFNHSLGVRQVVSEIASSGRGTGGTVSSTGTVLSQAPRLCALAAACLLAWYVMPEAQAADCFANSSATYVACVTNAVTDDTVIFDADIAVTTSVSNNKNLTVNIGNHTFTASADNNLGGETLVFDGGTLRGTRNTPPFAISANRTFVLNAGGGTFHNDDDFLLQITGLITGTGGLTKTGSGALNLTEDNDYDGPTTVSAGTLRVGMGNEFGTLGNGNVAIANGASVVFSRSDTFTAGNQISGEGAVQKQGTGTMILSNANTYSGGTTISAGTLSVSADNNLGDTSLTDTSVGRLTFNGGALQTTADITTNRTTTLGALGGTIAPAANTTLTQQGVISGTGRLTKTGPGTLVLSGTNTYSGGTTISQGTLQVGDGISSGSIAGDVVNNGTLAFNRIDAVNFSGVISGAQGIVRKDGTGTLTLTGANSYEGGTVIERGTVSISSNDNLGAATGTLLIGQSATLQTNGDITMNRDTAILSGTISTNSGTLTHNGEISGTTGLIKTGAGTLVLTGANTYTQGTLVTQGTLSISADENLGPLDTMGFGLDLLDLDGGTLRTTGAFTMERPINIGLNGGTFETHADLTASNVIASNLADCTPSPCVGLTKTGASTLALTGINTYWGGTHINAGVLSVTADNNLGDAAYGLSFNGGTLQNTAAFTTARAVTLNGSGTLQTDANLSLAGTIGGAGSLSKTGAGTLELLGDNTYSGGTTISAGTLLVGNGGASGTLGTGAVTNNAALVFNRSGTLTAANISGTGTLGKQGTGNLILSGTSTYTGATTVSAGTLSVNGSITSATTVNSGGTLGGSGTVGNVNIASGGTLAPGNSIGTLTVNGNLTFAPGSIYRVETDAAGNADRVNVVGAPGTLTINGGTVDVQAGAGNYARNTNYTILTSTGATTGTFTGVTSNLAFLRPTLIYQPNSVVLSLLAGEDAPSYSSVAQTPNQISVANYLGGFSSTPGNAAAAALIQQIDNLTAEQARTAFDSMSGSPHASASQIAMALGRNFSATLATRTGFGLGSAGPSASGTAGLKTTKFASVSPALMTRNADVVNDSPVVATAADAPGAAGSFEAQSVGGLWGQAMGTGGRTGSDGNGPESRYRANGFVFGYDQALSPEWLGGIALGYTRTQWDANTRGIAPANGRIGTPQAGLYARYTDGPWQVRLDGTYSDHRFSTDRTVTIGNASSIARSSHGGTEWAFAAQAEYSMPSGDWDIRPLAGLRHARLSEDGFTETGAGAASLTADARRTQNTVASLGVKFIRPMRQSTDTSTLELRAIASHLMGDNDSPITARLASQPGTFTAAGTPLKRTALTLGGTLTGQLSRGLSAYADAAYEYRGAGQNAFQLTAGLKLAW